MIDWSKLKTYHDDKRRSFEELCYQVAKGLHGADGSFTRLDDSGGGDGVEFYLTLPTGEQLGWQAKFYFPNQRFNVSNRKASIEGSLRAACRVHPQLTKWILCTPSNLTADERTWFESTLRESIPEEMNVELIHWGDSDFNDWLSEPRFAGKRHYFFGELELTLDWFRNQVARGSASVQDKFIAELHTETSVDEHIHALLADEGLVATIEEGTAFVQRQFDGYLQAVAEFEDLDIPLAEGDDEKLKLVQAASRFKDIADLTIAQLLTGCGLIKDHNLDDVRRLELDVMSGEITQAFDEIAQVEGRFHVSLFTYTGEEEKRARTVQEVDRMARRLTRMAADITDSVQSVVTELDCLNQTELHILGDAGVGKTHIACHICEQRVSDGLPALLLRGASFNSDHPLADQLLRLLDVPRSYSWSDFLRALEVAGAVNRSRIPIMIDGLNEATHNGVFSTVWRLHLSALVQELKEVQHVVLITTCRSTYREGVWPDSTPPNLYYARGFEAQSVEVAVRRYFSYYKINANVTPSSLSHFAHPIYLRIFCEATNPGREEEKEVYVGEYTLFQVFDQYLKLSNKIVCERLGLYPGADVVSTSLERIGKYMWENRSRSIPLSELVEVIDGQSIDNVNWQMSKTKAVIDEGLLLCRDWQDGDIVYFTYDLLGGYVIAQHLIREHKEDLRGFANSAEVTSLLFRTGYQTLHPLHPDVRRAFAALAPIQLGQYLHDLSNNPVAVHASVTALFEIPPTYVDEHCVAFVNQLFGAPHTRKRLLELAALTMTSIGHPLNADFWSERVKALSMPERDVAWTEHVRHNLDQFRNDVSHLEMLCREGDSSSTVKNQQVRLLANCVRWVLTSTVRSLRDLATRALYWYGRVHPSGFLELLVDSLDIDDPYICERMLAACHGVAMARQHDFRDSSFVQDHLPTWGRKLYETMFMPDAPHSTTHILSRDFARRTIDIALLHHATLLTPEEQLLVSPPFQQGGIRNWGQSEDRNEGQYRDGNAPFFFLDDYEPMGLLGPGIDKYKSDTPEYQQAKANLWWRIYDLGYSLERFGDMDKDIARSEFPRTQPDSSGVTDHYGRKYCQIAWSELAGYRDDLNLLRSEWMEPHERSGHSDIDPSFPEKERELNLVHTDFLGDRSIPVEQWISHGEGVNLDPYLILDKLDSERGPWILLDGYIRQEDSVASRARFVFPRGFIVKIDELDQIAAFLEMEDLGRFRFIPEDYHTFAGEIPWCDTFPLNASVELAFVTSTTPFIDKEDRLVITRDGQPIRPQEEREFWDSISARVLLVGDRVIQLGNQNLDEVIEAALKQRGLDARRAPADVSRLVEERQVFEVLVPVRENCWERGNAAHPDRRVAVPAREIAEHFQLCGQPQTFDLFEASGRRASVTFKHGNGWLTTHWFTFLRQDLLDCFLRETRSALIWVIWGEREFSDLDYARRKTFAESNDLWKAFQQVKVYRALGE